MPYRVIFVCVMGFVNTTMHEFWATKYRFSVIIFTRGMNVVMFSVEPPPVRKMISILPHLSNCAMVNSK